MYKNLFKIIGCSLVLSVGMISACTFLMNDKDKQLKTNLKGSDN